jgi:hypothetical protein
VGVGVESVHLNLRRVIVAEKSKSKAGWVARRREEKRLKRERTGPSPEAAHEQRKPSTEYDAEKSVKIGEQMLGGGGGG